MSGLFGLVTLDSSAPDEVGRALFERMGQALRHFPSDRIETYLRFDRGFCVARVGQPHLHPITWPNEISGDPKPNDRRSLRDRTNLVAGVLHGPGRSDITNDEPIVTLNHLRGFFSIAQIDERRIVLAVDRHASLPLYYAVVDGLLIFAPEVRALLLHPRLPSAVDAGAIAHFLVAGFLPLDLTLSKSVRRLRGGHAIVIEEGRLKIIEYWRYRPGMRIGNDRELELEQRLGDLIETSAARNIGNPEKTAIFLSGGFDSRAILGACMRVVGKDKSRLRTVSWGINRGPVDSDVAVAEKLAHSFGLQHSFIERRSDTYAQRFHEVNGLLGAQSDMAAFHPHEYEVMKQLQACGFERVLRGDECFGWLHQVNSYAGARAAIGLRRFRDAANGSMFLRPELYSLFCDAADDAFPLLDSEVHGMTADQAKDYFYFSVRLQGYLNTASYFKLCVLDQRNIFLDEEVIDFLEEIPDSLRLEKKFFRNVARKRFPDLYSIPIARRNNLENWGSLLAKDGSDVRSYVMNQLSDQDSAIWTWFDRQACQRFMENILNTGPVSNRTGLVSFLANTFMGFPYWLRGPIQARRVNRAGFFLRPEYMLLRVVALKDWIDRL